MQTKTTRSSETPASSSAQAIDRLGIVTLLASLYFFQTWGLTAGTSTLPPQFHHAMMGISALGIVFPRFWQVLSVNALAFVCVYLIDSPISSNNLTTAFFFAVVVLAVYLKEMLHRPHIDLSREDRFIAIAGPARWLLAGLYFYGIYHKINADFLDPTVSCAVVLYQTLAVHIALQDFAPGHYLAIYITFIIEAVAMVALFIPRLKALGMLIGLPFHIIIGFSGYAYYKDFSTIVLVLYALFLTKSSVEFGVSRIANSVGGQATAARLGRLVLFAFVAIYFVASGAFNDIHNLRPTHKGFVSFFAFYTFIFYVFVALSLGKLSNKDTHYHWNWLYIIPVLFFLNGMSPYLGLKTKSSMAMFSNLHTEGGQTNHLLTGRLPGTFTYQENPVVVESSNNSGFDSVFAKDGKALVRYEFDKILSLNPDLKATVTTREGTRITDESWVNTYENTNWLLQKFLVFKPVDFNRPKVCTH